MSIVYMNVLFSPVVTMIGLLIRLLGKDVLMPKFDKNEDSYCIPEGKVKLEKSDYKRQF